MIKLSKAFTCKILFIIFLENGHAFCFGALNVTSCPEDGSDIYDDYCPTKAVYSWTIITGSQVKMNLNITDYKNMNKKF